jgi:hypothetical protein
MAYLRAAISFLMIASLGHAAEIVAWKIPLNRFAHRGLQSNGIARLASAPEASTFFNPGDELWDLKGIPTGQDNNGHRIEPTIGENEDLVDLRIDFQNGIKPSLSQAIQSSATLQNDTWLELLSGNPADAKNPAPLRAKAVVTSPLE